MNMSKIEKIRAEIERQMKFYDEKEMKAWDDSEQGDEDALWYQGHRKMCAKLLTFLDTLPDENNPEPYNPVYDEDYLNEKITKATKSWEGVDVNKMLAECRGYEEEPDKSLEEEIRRYLREECSSDDEPATSETARHFAEWQKAQMLKDAVEGKVYFQMGGIKRVKSDDFENPDIHLGDKVKLIIVKEDK